MKRLATLLAITFAAVAASAYAADPQEPGRSGDPVSAEKKAVKKKKAKTGDGHAQEPGRSGDPVSAEKKAKPGGDVKAAGPHPDEPGRAGDPVSAEKAKK